MKADRYGGRKRIPLLDPAFSWRAIQYRKLAAQETQIVERIFKEFSLPEKQKWRMYRETKRSSGHGRLLFSSFHDLFPEFPVYFRMGEMTISRGVALEKLFTQFFAKVFAKAYYEWQCEYVPGDIAEPKPLAMVFPWERLQRFNGLVISTFGPFHGPGMRLVWTDDRQTLCLQTVASLLEDIRRET